MDLCPGSPLYAGRDVLRRVPIRASTKYEATMIDLLLVGLVALFFAGAVGYVRVCGWL